MESHKSRGVRTQGAEENILGLRTEEAYLERLYFLLLIIYYCYYQILEGGMSGTWSLTLREEHRLRVFEIRVLRRIFGPKRDGVTVEWRKLHNEELRDLYSSSSVIRIFKSRRMRWACHVARMGENRNAYRYWWESQRERDH
jgi:hypothetical protein